MEQWKRINNYPQYQVSNLGSIKREYPNGKFKMIKPLPSGCYRYLMVTLCKNSQATKSYIHRIVADHFLPNPDPKNYSTVGFKNKDGQDCRVENLYWTNQQELMQLRQQQDRYYKGSEHHASRLTEKDVIEIRKMKADGFRNVDICKLYGIHNATLSAILKRHTWKHVL